MSDSQTRENFKHFIVWGNELINSGFTLYVLSYDAHMLFTSNSSLSFTDVGKNQPFPGVVHTDDLVCSKSDMPQTSLGGSTSAWVKGNAACDKCQAKSEVHGHKCCLISYEDVKRYGH